MNNEQGSFKKMEELMERMEERAKRQEERETAMLKKLRKQEEVLSEMQKRLDSIEKKTRDSPGTNRDVKAKAADAAVKQVKTNRKPKKDQKRVDELMTKESSIQGCRHYKFNRQVHSHLTGNLMVLRDRILIGESRICVGKDGDFFSFDEFRKLVGGIQMQNPREYQNALSFLHNPLWLISPEKYEVECCGSSCKKMLPLTTTIRDDCVTAKCPHCDNWTLLGNPFPGYKWIKLFPCGHFTQIRNDGLGPENCHLHVAKECVVRIEDNLDAFIRTPRRIYDHSK